MRISDWSSDVCSSDLSSIRWPKPPPRRPSTSSWPSWTLSKNSSEVSAECRPILSRLRPRLKPGSEVSSVNSVVPLAPVFGSVLAASTTTTACWPLVMKVFEPLRTKPSPSGVALVDRKITSLPPRPHPAPLPPATEHVVLAELEMVEEQLRGIGRMQAVLVEIAAALETGQRGVEREQRRSLGAGFRIGLGGKHDHAGMLAVGDEGCRAVEDEAITVRRRAGLHALQVGTGARLGHADRADAFTRSEEHTSELQSLMRNSYAVFCLKKKKHKTH